MAQDPEQDDLDEGSVDPSHDLDMVSLFSSTTVDAEIEADVIRGVLDSNGIPSLMIRAMGYPNLGFDVLVPRVQQEEARRLVQEAEDAGPEAAAEGERASEEG